MNQLSRGIDSIDLHNLSVVRKSRSRESRRTGLVLATALTVIAVGLFAAGPASADIVTSTPGVTTIPVGSSPTSVTVSPDGSLAYVLNQDDNSVSVIRSSSNTVTATIALPASPWNTLFSPDGQKAYIFSYFGRSVTVVDVARSSVLTTVNLAVSPDFASMSTDGSRIIIDDTQRLSIFDTQTDVEAETTMPPREGSVYAIAISPDGSKVYETHALSGNGTLRVVDTTSGAVISETTVGTEPQGVVVTPDGSTALVMNDSSVSKVDLLSASVTGNIPTQPTKGIVLSPNGTKAILFTHYDTAVAIDVASSTGATPIPVAQAPVKAEFSSDSSDAYLLSCGPFAGTGSVSKIGVAANAITATIGIGHGASDMAFDPDQSKVYATDTTDAAVSAIDLPLEGWRPTVTRIFGSDRFDTSVAISQEWLGGGSAMTLFVAAGTDFPDALGAAAIAGQSAVPLLLTAPDALPAGVKAEIQRLQPQSIRVIGGPKAVSDAVLTELSTLSSDVSRLAGSDRFETDQAVIGFRFSAHSAPNHVYVATGTNFPDALSAAAAAAFNNAPVVLVNGGASTLDESTRTFLQQLNGRSYTIVGGPNAVSTGVEAGLASLAPTDRLAGSDRFETSEVLNKATFSDSSRAYFATGSGFADALAGSTLAGGMHSPLYVVRSTCIPETIAADLASAPAGAVTLFGGTSALSDDVARLKTC